MRKSLIALAAVSALAAAPAWAAIDSYWAPLYGASEFPGPGDPDGFGLAVLSIDTSNNSVSWAIQAQNIALPLTGAHIHAGAAGTAGPVIINFNAVLTGVTSDPDAASINPGNASGFYVNLHNSAYPGGAIRGQLAYVGSVNVVPEPETYALMLAGLAGVLFMGRRRERTSR